MYSMSQARTAIVPWRVGTVKTGSAADAGAGCEGRINHRTTAMPNGIGSSWYTSSASEVAPSAYSKATQTASAAINTPADSKCCNDCGVLLSSQLSASHAQSHGN